ncbi:hypothetical protein ACFYWP_02090 [Actinacidiphila glaucinigra]|uniref:hypothetical protein n=1 Tax=Actinacidiphila glaucinigra TaxID=235986 RepID=UPI0036C04E35
MREVTREESFFSWQDIAAVTVRRPPTTVDIRPWLAVWPLPGSRPHDDPSYLVDGHKAFALDAPRPAARRGGGRRPGGAGVRGGALRRDGVSRRRKTGCGVSRGTG